jgi:hypothetical protein
VLLDSGVRRGNDVLLAVAIEAKAVLVGRLVAMGLAVGGEARVARMLSIIQADMIHSVRLMVRPRSDSSTAVGWRNADRRRSAMGRATSVAYCRAELQDPARVGESDRTICLSMLTMLPLHPYIPTRLLSHDLATESLRPAEWAGDDNDTSPAFRDASASPPPRSFWGLLPRGYGRGCGVR